MRYMCNSCGEEPCTLEFLDSDMDPFTCPFTINDMKEANWERIDIPMNETIIDKELPRLMTLDKGDNMTYIDELKKPITFRELRKMKVVEFHDEIDHDTWRDIKDNSIVKLGDCLIFTNKKHNIYIALEPIITEGITEAIRVQEMDGIIEMTICTRPRFQLRRIYYEESL